MSRVTIMTPSRTRIARTRCAMSLRWCSHELASRERSDIRRAEFKPFPVLPSQLKPLVPVGLDSSRVVCSDSVNRRGSFGKLYLELVLSTSGGHWFFQF